MKNLWKKWGMFLNMEQVHPHKKTSHSSQVFRCPSNNKGENMLGIMPSNYTLNFF